MAEARYKIVFDGQLMPEMTLETVKENLARLFKSDRAKIDNLFSGNPVALKRDLPAREADKYLVALQQAGANARKELDLTLVDDRAQEEAASEAATETARMSCPKCGHEQPKAVECAACGIIIEKYLARQAQLQEQQASAPAVAPAAASPYATPQAQVGETLPEYGELRPFGVEGRIGRLRYIAWSMVLMFAAVPLMGVAAMGFALSDIVGGLLIGVVAIAMVVVSVMIGVQRLHDIGWSGWLYLLNLVPIVGSVFPLLMLIIPGTPGANRFGPPQPPNSTAVKVLAGIFLGLIVVALIGMIVAISIGGFAAFSGLEGMEGMEGLEGMDSGAYESGDESWDYSEQE